MLTIKQFLTAAGLETPHSRIKLVRHSDHMDRSIRQIITDGAFDRYQAEQLAHVAPFHKCEVILSFIKIEGKLSEFHGVYRVSGHRNFQPEDFDGMPEYLYVGHQDGKDRIWYLMEELPEFRPLRGRLIAEWSNPVKWHLTQDQKLHELRPPGRVRFFPGYQNVVVTWKELKEICKNPASHPDWVAAMKFTAAIYRIVDLESGKTYIGSAYGKEGLWHRWCDYAKSGDGGNKELKNLNPDNFQWSIVRTLSGVMSKRDVIIVEQIEKVKHGSRAVGLNGN
jgi:hypothetical protein